MPLPEPESTHNPQPQDPAAATPPAGQAGAPDDTSAGQYAALPPQTPVEVARPEWPQGPVEPSFLSRYGKYFIGVAVLYLLAGVGVRQFVRSFQRQFEQTNQKQALHVEQGTGRHLTVSWNRQLPVVAAANRATLAIFDGASKEEVVLDAARLRSGSLEYYAKSRFVRFEFQIGQPGRFNSLSETLVMTVQ